jgi:hypothetical protein
MAEWWSIEVFSSDKLPASSWRYAYEDELTEAVITNGAVYYEWHDTQYGVVLEALLPGDREWEIFRALPAVRAALDGVPDPVNGLLIYRGRGGASGGSKPRKPKPAPGAAAAELDEPRPMKVARAIKYRAEQVDRVLRELGRPGRPEAEPTGPEPAPGAEPALPAPEPVLPERGDPEHAGRVWRDIAAFDRSGI